MLSRQGGYLLQVLPDEYPIITFGCVTLAAPNHRTKRSYNKITKEILISLTTTSQYRN